MENVMNRQPQTTENYTDSVNFSQEALRMQNSDKGQMEEKTWDGPLGQVTRETETQHSYTQPEAEPRSEGDQQQPDIQPQPGGPDTGTPQPMGSPDEVMPQTQEPTIIQNPAAEYDSQDDENDEMDSEDLEEDVVEHSERGNMNDMRGYNEPKSRESEYYK
jgi:hypothetical protein